MRRRERLPGREQLFLDGRLERVVVAVRAATFLEGNPPQDRFVGDRVVDATGPRRREHLSERPLEGLVLPFAVAGADALDESAGVTLLARVDRNGEALPQGDDDR